MASVNDRRPAAAAPIRVGAYGWYGLMVVCAINFSDRQIISILAQDRATYILGTTMVGLALGPYFAGNVADVTQDLSSGIFALYAVPPSSLLLCGSPPASWVSLSRASCPVPARLARMCSRTPPMPAAIPSRSRFGPSG